MRGWRLMDKDNSNTCNWPRGSRIFGVPTVRYEFLSASKVVGFEDPASAWLVLDKDLSGAISLAEIDSTANEMLIELKQWADQEFGGVRAAFRVLDKDKSGELSLKEFRIAAGRPNFQENQRNIRCSMVFSNGLSIDVRWSFTLPKVSIFGFTGDEVTLFRPFGFKVSELP